MSKTIKWEKFQNPLISVDDSGEDDENGRVMIRHTPFGVEALKFNPNFPNEKVFTGHTNFDIDKYVQSVIEDTEGVEILEVYSPYRFRLTIGKAFNSKKVRRLITNKLCHKEQKPLFDKDVNVKIYAETLHLRESGKPWIMYILPNGNYESFSSDNQDEMEKNFAIYEQHRSILGGTILSD